MALAFRYDIPPSEFWRLTPYQTQVIFRTLNRKAEDAAVMARYQAWHTANMTRAKKLPPLQNVIKAVHNEPQDRAGKIDKFRGFFKNIKVSEKVIKIKRRRAEVENG